MSPLRIVILGVLFYFLYKLFFGKKKVTGTGTLSGSGKAGGQAVQDLLVEDPVCHTYVPKGQAVHLESGDATYYFCSSKCRDEFISNHSEKGD